jgi:hypothetical protein
VTFRMLCWILHTRPHDIGRPLMTCILNIFFFGYKFTCSDAEKMRKKQEEANARKQAEAAANANKGGGNRPFGPVQFFEPGAVFPSLFSCILLIMLTIIWLRGFIKGVMCLFHVCYAYHFAHTHHNFGASSLPLSVSPCFPVLIPPPPVLSLSCRE